MGYDVRQGDALVFLLVSSTDHITGQTGKLPTVTIRKPSGVFITPQGAVTEIGNGNYQVAGNILDTDTLGPLLLHAEATGCDPVDTVYGVVSLVSGDDDTEPSSTQLTASELLILARDEQSMTVDGQTVSARSANDIIALDQYAITKAAQAAGSDAWGNCGYRKAIPPGTSGGNRG